MNLVVPMTPKVWKRNGPPGAIYVGRPSKWGNPFKVRLPHDDRAAVIRQYAEWLADDRELLSAAQTELRGKHLVCWCAPLPCHADILLRIANAVCARCQRTTCSDGLPLLAVDHFLTDLFCADCCDERPT